MSNRYVYSVEGMHCPACVNRVELAAKAVEGIENPKADYVKGTLTFECNNKPDTQPLKAALEDAGYNLSDKKSQSRNVKSKQMISTILIVAAVIAIYFVLKQSGLLVYLNFFPQAGEETGYLSLFVIGLLTSFHCIAMCGGINLTQSSLAVKNGASLLKSNLLYQLGRVISYTLIGGIIGALGKALSINNSIKGGITVFAGVFMAVMAVNMLGGFSFLRKLQPRMPKKLSSRLNKGKKGHGSFYIGLVNGLMPCGPLQSMQIFALASGGFFSGALSMFLFCVGTIPLLFLFGFISGKLNQKFTNVMMKVSAVLVLLLSISMLQNGIALFGLNASVNNNIENSNVAVIQDGKQYVTSYADYDSYDPITVYEDIPVVWTLVVPEGKLIGCNNEIIVNEYGLDVKLVEGENIIEFTPDDSGTYTYSCWMGMIKSTITVE